MTNPTRTDHSGIGGGSADSQAGGGSADRAVGSTPSSYRSAPAAESDTSSSETTDFSKLREEVASLKDIVSKSIAGAGSDAWKTVRDVGETVASQVGNAASGVMEAGASMANAAGAQAKTAASEIESAVRKNPLGAMAGALVAGILIGLVGRGRG
jgi:ElaB/YqjD/DUF883 family membrane-anchored ribosome-binding protein